MKYKDLEKLGFKKEQVSAEESGYKEYVYYTYDFCEEPEEFCLISSDSDEDKCFVEIFNSQHPIRFYKTKHVRKLINAINKGI
jgi:tRNA(Ile)-lysidine synthase TilS/MesJ